tara:strand:- start:10367 stop:10639 length:273 start_codon:yes stop_codon:yes gene_type:complete
MKKWCAEKYKILIHDFTFFGSKGFQYDIATMGMRNYVVGQLAIGALFDRQQVIFEFPAGRLSPREIVVSRPLPACHLNWMIHLVLKLSGK